LAERARLACGSLAVAFFVPLVFSDALGLHHDLYMLVYVAAVGGLVIGYIRQSELGWSPFVRSWRLSVLLGVFVGAALAFFVLSHESTDRPSGIYLGFEVLWRGAIYGAADALLLTAMPVLLVLNLMHGKLTGIAAKLKFLVSAYSLVALITLVYHAGYQDFRDQGFDQEGLRGPLTGSPMWSAPALLSANPVGAIVAHSTMHVTAVAHEYETDLFLPPRVQAGEASRA
jgi:hypothetical protein